MKQSLPIEIEKINKSLLKRCLGQLKKEARKYFLRNEILAIFDKFLETEKKSFSMYENRILNNFVKKIQEIIIHSNDYILVYRYKLAKNTVYRVKSKSCSFEVITLDEYLNIRDQVITGRSPRNGLLNIDFMPFYDYSPMIKNTDEIGNGISFLNKVMSTRIFQEPEKWNRVLFDFLHIHRIQGKQLLINERKIQSPEKLVEKLEYILNAMSKITDKNECNEIFEEMEDIGFASGWGNTLIKIKQTMQMLLDLFNSPDSRSLENFISKIPMISKIAVISPHGWFGQKDVLGKPDTGGQVVYILDQVKYLEKHLQKSLSVAGIKLKPKVIVVTRLIPDSQGTTSNERLEKIENTDNAWILRVPFRNSDGSIHPRWISRFHIWPFLEQFARDAKDELIKELNGRPDLLIGNYSDGNLVAAFLSTMTGVTQCNIAHALEKTKYIFSDLYWKDMEKEYNFSLQFTADLITMNTASFIITSTFCEIAGTEETRGQYENYQFFSMPDLYHVKGGINLFHPKFNVIPPGVDEDIYFPYTEATRRNLEITQKLSDILFSRVDDFIYGELKDPEKIPLFAMSRLDKIKNITGLLLSYAENTKLRDMSNLIIIAGKLKPEDAGDDEERKEILLLHELIKKYDLHGSVRWIAKTFEKKEAGEIYRIIADRKGVFIQPALFEGFGLTVLEAMISGLPTFATHFGGPAEIIENRKNGFLINPTLQSEMSDIIVQFLKQCVHNSGAWDKVSSAGIKRVKKHFNWNLYAARLINLAKLHSFWIFSVSAKAKEKMRLYCDVIYDDFIRKRL